MATENEDFPYQSADPDLQPAQGQPMPPIEIDGEAYQDFKMLVRLLIGTAVEGSDEFSHRAGLWRDEMNRADPSRMVISPGDETEVARLRYILIGLLFQAMDAGTSNLSLLNKAASKTLRAFSIIFSPLTHSRVWRPVQDNFDRSRERGESVVNSWIEIGRREEQASRYLARKQAYEDVIDDAIDYLAHKPEVSDLVQQQSVGMAEEILNDLRERSSKYDFLLDDKFKKAFRRQRPPKTDTA